jgi:hypothetical protein
MKKLIFSLIVIGFVCQMYAQDIKLPEVIISAVNYKYLNAVNTEDSDPSVTRLEQEVAFYNVKESDLYEDDYDSYMIEFYIPDGRIIAAYDSNGELLRTIEKFKSVKLPKDVRDAVFTSFPNWTLDKDAYYVNYDSNKDVKKVYKIKLRNGKEVLRVKIDAEGNFM